MNTVDFGQTYIFMYIYYSTLVTLVTSFLLQSPAANYDPIPRLPNLKASKMHSITKFVAEPVAIKLCAQGQMPPHHAT